MTFLAVRMGFAVVIMAAIALLAGARRPNANEIGHSLVAGSLVHGLTLGGVFTAISQGVPAGISALILGLQPIVTSTLANRFMGEKITRLQSVGLALGLVGVLLVLHDRNIVLAGSVLGWVASFLSLSALRSGRCTRSAIADASTGAPAISSSTSVRECCLRLALLHSKRAKSIGPAS